MAEQYASGGEETHSGSDDEGQLRGRGGVVTSTASSTPGPAAGSLYGRRANVHHHGAAAERCTLRLSTIRDRTTTRILCTHQLLSTGLHNCTVLCPMSTGKFKRVQHHTTCSAKWEQGPCTKGDPIDYRMLDSSVIFSGLRGLLMTCVAQWRTHGLARVGLGCMVGLEICRNSQSLGVVSGVEVGLEVRVR